MEDNKKYMTIYFKKKSLTIERLITGKQDKLIIYPLTEEEMNIIYGKIIIEYDDYIFNNRNLFEIIKKDNNEYIIDMKEEYKKLAKKYS